MVYLDFSHVVDYFYKDNQNYKADPSGILKIPKDLILACFLYLGKADLKNAFLTCRQWSKLSGKVKEQNFGKELVYLIKRLEEQRISDTSSNDSRYTNLLNTLIKRCEEGVEDLKWIALSNFSDIQTSFFEYLIDAFKHCHYSKMEELYDVVEPILSRQVEERLKAILDYLKTDTKVRDFLQLCASSGRPTNNDLLECYEELNSTLNQSLRDSDHFLQYCKALDSIFNQVGIGSNDFNKPELLVQVIPDLPTQETARTHCIPDLVDIIYNHYKIEREKLSATDYLKKDIDIVGFQDQNLKQVCCRADYPITYIYMALLFLPCMLSKLSLKPCKLKQVEYLAQSGWNPQNYLKHINAQLKKDVSVIIFLIFLLYAESQNMMIPLVQPFKAIILYKVLLYSSRAYHLYFGQHKISQVYKRQIQGKGEN